MARAYVVATIVIMLVCMCANVYADLMNMPDGLTNLEMVLVGDPGNNADTRNHCGAVNYAYKIGKFEITAGQYADFLNAKAKSDAYGLYNNNMTNLGAFGCNIRRSGDFGSYTYSVDPNWANRPVNYVSYWDACRFVNWLNNGQGNGDTETGAYNLNEYNGNDGRDIQRNAGAKWFLPNKDEWYKAAYYKGNGTNTGYWSYPTQSDSAPSNQLITPDGGNNANVAVVSSDGFHYAIGYPYYRTNVGEFENSESAYGTFDQGGNVWEYNETLTSDDNSRRSNCGGSFVYNSSVLMSVTSGYGLFPNDEIIEVGFRVAEAVPEPSTVASILGMLGGLACSGVRGLVPKNFRGRPA